MDNDNEILLWILAVIAGLVFLYIFLTWWYKHDQVIMLGALL